MNKTIIVAIVIGVVILGLSTILVAQNRSTSPNPQQKSDASPAVQAITPLSVTVAMAAQNNSGETGTAVLTKLEDGKTKVTLNLTGAPQNITQPAHIHLGSCAALGDVLFPLQPPLNGQSETLLDIDLQKDILDKLPLAVNVHKSLGEINIFFSCGDIGSSSAQGGTNSSATPTSSPTSSPTASPDDRQGGGGIFRTPDDKRRGADKPED